MKITRQNIKRSIELWGIYYRFNKKYQGIYSDQKADDYYEKHLAVFHEKQCRDIERLEDFSQLIAKEGDYERGLFESMGFIHLYKSCLSDEENSLLKNLFYRASLKKFSGYTEEDEELIINSLEKVYSQQFN